MLISKGKVAPSEPWNILEVAIGQAPDVLAIRLAKELKRLRERAIECFVPMRRNLAGDAEWIIEHVYVRGANGSLGRLARTPGIDSIRPELAEQPWIDQLSAQEQTSHKLKLRSFVRILTGPCARLCGHVTNLSPGHVTVSIKLRTKTIRVMTIPRNLQSVHCPPEQQVFFYQRELFV